MEEQTGMKCEQEACGANADASLRRLAVRTVAVAIDAGIRSLYRIRVRGLEHFSQAPSTLVVTNHQRDADGPIIASALFDRHGLEVRGVLPYFVAREDLFRRGFLGDYLTNWPPLLREPLLRLSLRSFLLLMQAHPMRRIPERSIGEVLEDALAAFGDLPLTDVLQSRWVRRFQSLAGAEGGPLHISDVLKRRRYRKLLAQGRGLSRLTRQRLHALEPYERAVIDAQLQRFAELLEQGETVLLAPEGTISPDGHFHPVRNALPILVNRPRVPTRVLPIGITHDFMAGGRTHVFVNVGPEITDLWGRSRKEICARVTRAILSQSTVTATQLASSFLIGLRSRGEAIVEVPELRDYVARKAERFSAAGAYVDPRLLESSALAARMERYIDYCLRLGSLEPCSDRRYRLHDVEGRRPLGWMNRERPIRYAGNELASVARLWHEPRKAS